MQHISLRFKWMEECAVKRTNYLPLLAFLLGLLCQCLRRLLYRTAVDGTGLLRTGTALEWCVYALAALAILLFAAAVRKKWCGTYITAISALGQLAGAGGIGWTVLRYPAEMSGVLGALWKISGAVAALCLLWTAFCSWRRRKPHFLAQLAPCLFWLVHMVDNYRNWSGQPQLQSYLFDLLGAMTMTLFAYYTAAFAVGMGKRRMQRFTALAAGFLGTAAAMPNHPKTQMLYLLCALWALTNLCSRGVKEIKKAV